MYTKWHQRQIVKDVSQHVIYPFIFLILTQTGSVPQIFQRRFRVTLFWQRCEHTCNTNTQTLTHSCVLLCSSSTKASGIFSAPPALIITSVIKVRAAVKHTHPLTSRELSHWSPWKLMLGVKLRCPQQDGKLVLAWSEETGLKGCPVPTRWIRRCGRDSESMRGSKMWRYQTHIPATAPNPPPGLTETGTDPHKTPCHSTHPEGSSRKAQEFGTGNLQGLQLRGEFLPSFIFALLLSGIGIPVFPVWLSCPPSSVFWDWFCSRARVS